MKCSKNIKNSSFKLDELVKYVITDNSEINGTVIQENQRNRTNTDG